jgi:DNA-directed RNA polymerase beta subunit
MAYSYTERKRIRKSFGSRDSVLEVPYLLQMQKDAYTAFLQADTAPKQRTPEIHRVHAGQARVRRARVSDPWFDVCFGRARPRATHHLRP